MSEAVSIPEHLALALLVEGHSHGFAVSRLLLSGGDVGRVYTVARPATYRAISRLEAMGLVERVGTEPGSGGPERTLFAATAAGAAESARWLAEPVGHVRDMRTEFLAKLVLLDRAGADRRALVAAQLAVIGPIVASRVPAGPPGATNREDVIALWRYTSAQAALRFLEDLAQPDA